MDEADPTPAKERAEAETERKAASDAMIWTRIFYGREVMERILDTIQVKQSLHQRFVLRYAARAAMAGLIVCLMYVFAYQVKTDLGHDLNVAFNKYLTSLSFSGALVFIYFSNSELLTSNFMYFTVGRYYGKVRLVDELKIWAICLLGNLAGITFIAALVCSCGMLSKGFVSNLMETVQDKTVGSSPGLIFTEAIIANYFINISVIVAMQVKESLAKIVVLLLGVTIFAYMGFEHVIANSALFILALFENPSAVSLLHVGKNFVFSLAGNYVGGGLIIGLFYAYLNDHRGERPRATAA
ncbi:MAG TPA: formate/nitrite transporter family protein [Chthoniobacterales bacterium]|jgi:formate/nitrite transporter FocA (FNT family)